MILKNGRDNSRTPMQWNNDNNAGFTSGIPWIKVNPNYKQINVRKAIQDPNSVYHYYEKLIQLRKSNKTAVYGKYDLILPNHQKIFAYTRTLAAEKLLIIVNLSNKDTVFTMPKSISYNSIKLLLGNYTNVSEKAINNIMLKPYESRVYLLRI